MNPPVLLEAKTVLDLQRLAGNQYVGSLLRKQRERGKIISNAGPEILPETVSDAEPDLPPVRGLPPAAKRTQFWWAVVAALACSIAVYEAVRWTARAVPILTAMLAGLAGGAGVFLTIHLFVSQQRKRRLRVR